jgi:hypothetical protein
VARPGGTGTGHQSQLFLVLPLRLVRFKRLEMFERLVGLVEPKMMAGFGDLMGLGGPGDGRPRVRPGDAGVTWGRRLPMTGKLPPSA